MYFLLGKSRTKEDSLLLFPAGNSWWSVKEWWKQFFPIISASFLICHFFPHCLTFSVWQEWERSHKVGEGKVFFVAIWIFLWHLSRAIAKQLNWQDTDWENLLIFWTLHSFCDCYWKKELDRIHIVALEQTGVLLSLGQYVWFLCVCACFHGKEVEYVQIIYNTDINYTAEIAVVPLDCSVVKFKQIWKTLNGIQRTVRRTKTDAHTVLHMLAQKTVQQFTQEFKSAIADFSVALMFVKEVVQLLTLAKHLFCFACIIFQYKVWNGPFMNRGCILHIGTMPLDPIHIIQGSWPTPNLNISTSNTSHS